MDAARFVIVAVSWVVVGLVSGLWMFRRGHDPRWILITVALGPLFVPVALARAERRPRLARSAQGAHR